MKPEQLLARLADAARLRRGKVVEHRPGAVRVEFADRDQTVSYWLRITSAFSTEDRAQHTYPLGTPVECLTDERGEAGVVLGAGYSDDNPPPLTDLGQILYELAAGVKLLIDRNGPRLTLEVGPNKLEMGPEGMVITSPDFEFKRQR